VKNYNIFSVLDESSSPQSEELFMLCAVVQVAHTFGVLKRVVLIIRKQPWFCAKAVFL
jgi:hypothetical protein